MRNLLILSLILMAFSVHSHECFWKDMMRPGSKNYWENKQGLGTRSFFQKSRALVPGTQKFWEQGEGPGSQKFWEEGEGPGSYDFWENGPSNEKGSRRYWERHTWNMASVIPLYTDDFREYEEGEVVELVGYLYIPELVE
jgi:hypothetical protein